MLSQFQFPLKRAIIDLTDNLQDYYVCKNKIGAELYYFPPEWRYICQYGHTTIV